MTTPNPSIRRKVFVRRGEQGLTLIEFMVSIVLSMLLVAALSTLIANQSANRAEVDRSGRMLENGRYAIRTLADDLQLAGYWGELSSMPVTPGTMPDPCSRVASEIGDAMSLHVQGYDAPVAGAVPSCLATQNLLPGTDVIVVRHADADSSSLETTPTVPDAAKVVAAAGQVLIQTGVNSVANQNFEYRINAATSNTTTNGTMFPLLKKDLTTAATIRKVLVRIYFVSACSVPVGTSCTNADGGTPIPTLKVRELAMVGGTLDWTTVTVAEGIENLQVDYGVDSDSDGAADGADVNAASTSLDTPAKWTNVMGAKVYLLARSSERSPGFTDGKTYRLGTAGTTAATNDGYRRHVFLQSVRFVNPSARRTS